MPPQLVRILLAVALLPLASIMYVGTYLMLDENHLIRIASFSRRQEVTFVCSGALTWLFVSTYWTIVWHPLAAAREKRFGWLAWPFVWGLAAALVLHGLLMLGTSDRPPVILLDTIVAPTVWLITAALALRETDTERYLRTLPERRRLRIACLKCEYNMTGLQSTRCPECGTLFTLDELLLAGGQDGDFVVVDRWTDAVTAVRQSVSGERRNDG